MKQIVSIGELLIDFIPGEKGKSLQNIQTFHKLPGGAPANVCVQAAKLGVPATFIGQVGDDGFGKFLIETLKKLNVNVDHVFRSSVSKTALAFVTLTESGERDFMFYRNPSADQMLHVSQVKDIKIVDSIFHFCSLSLDNYPLKDALHHLLMKHKKHQNLISFDPNLRLSLFDNHASYQEVIKTYITYTDLLKVSDDELYFITQENNEEKAIQYLFSLGIKYLIITRGKDGVSYIDKHRTLNHSGYQVSVMDTTGAGDSWIGTFLSRIAFFDTIESISNDELYEILGYANAAAALTTSKPGAIFALPDTTSVKSFIRKNKSTF
jgi:fructokinase